MVVVPSRFRQAVEVRRSEVGFGGVEVVSGDHSDVDTSNLAFLD